MSSLWVIKKRKYDDGHKQWTRTYLRYSLVTSLTTNLDNICQNWASPLPRLKRCIPLLQIPSWYYNHLRLHRLKNILSDGRNLQIHHKSNKCQAINSYSYPPHSTTHTHKRVSIEKNTTIIDEVKYSNPLDSQQTYVQVKVDARNNGMQKEKGETYTTTCVSTKASFVKPAT